MWRLACLPNIEHVMDDSFLILGIMLFKSSFLNISLVYKINRYEEIVLSNIFHHTEEDISQFRAMKYVGGVKNG